MENILALLLAVGLSSGFLVQDDANSNTTMRQHSTNTSISELMTRLETRLKVQLEDRLHAADTKVTQLEQNHNDVTKVLQYEIASRQQLEAMYAGVKIELDNVTSKLEIVGLESKTIGAHLVYNTNKLNNFTEEVKVLQHDGSDKEQRIANLTRELVTVKSEYTALLSKYAHVGQPVGPVPTRHSHAGLTIAFSIGSPDGNTGHGSNPLRFLTYNSNHRNDFNMNSGEFVCKHQGLYYFSFTYASRYNYGYATCCIMRNGGRATSSSCALAGQATHTRYSSGTVALLLDLNVGDRVYVSECTSPKTMVQNTDFSGFLVGPN